MTTPQTHTITALPLTHLAPDPNQPRKHISAASVKGLAESLVSAGQQEPITVRPNPDKAGHYLIVHGERRFTAAKKAKLKTLDARLENLKEQNPDNQDWARLVYQMVDNMEREDLSAIDLANTFKQMKQQYLDDDGKEMTSEQIHKELKQYGLSQPPSASNIRNILRLLELPTWAQTHIRNGHLTAKHGRALLPVKDLPVVMQHTKKAIDDVVKEGGTVKAAELAELIYDITEDHYPTVREQAYISDWWDPDDYSSSVTLYDLKGLKKEDREQLGIIELDNGHGHKTCYATNLQAHKKKQAETRADIKEQRKKAKENKKQAAEKKETAATGSKQKPVNIEPREQGLRDHLNAWLGDTINNYLDTIDPSELIFDQLLMWRAFNQPSKPFDIDHDDAIAMTYGRIDGNNHELYKQLYQLGQYSLRCFLEGKPKHDEPIKLVAKVVIAELDLHQRAWLLKHLGIDITTHFRIDIDYLSLYTKDGILHLAKEAGIDIENEGNPALNKKKASELKDYITQNHADTIGCPGHILNLHEELVNEYTTDLDDALAVIQEQEQAA